jgi:hypothetical protein
LTRTLALILVFIPIQLPKPTLRQLLNRLLRPNPRPNVKPPENLLSRRRFLLVGAGAVYGGLWLVLGSAWYGRQPRTRWHWFDDHAEWLQVDKAGHTYSSYHLARFLHALLSWAGTPTARARGQAAWASFGAHAPIEVLDGFVPAYGASASDLVANAAGSGLYLAQSALSPGHAWLKPKFSFAPSPFAAQRPELLGRTLLEQFFKDYNGQVYWLSLAPSPEVAAAWHTHFPWLRLAVGYGATGLVRARVGQSRALGHSPRRRLLLGLDVDLGFLRQQAHLSPGAEVALSLAELYRLPGPELEWFGPVL